MKKYDHFTVSMVVLSLGSRVNKPYYAVVKTAIARVLNTGS